MRLEIEHLLRLDWSEAGIGFDDHVRSIVGKRLSATERKELCDLLRCTEDAELAAVVAAVMGSDPQPEYLLALKDAINRDNARIIKHAAMRLIDGEYPGYVEIVFSSPKAKDALGDDLPFEFSGRGGEFSPQIRQEFLALFCRRFGDKTPRLDAMTAPWFRMLAELRETNDSVARILVRIWNELRPSDAHNKYLILLAMSSRPHPVYEPVFSKAASSKVNDLRDLGTKGLDAMKGKS